MGASSVPDAARDTDDVPEPLQNESQRERNNHSSRSSNDDNDDNDAGSGNDSFVNDTDDEHQHRQQLDGTEHDGQGTWVLFLFLVRRDQTLFFNVSDPYTPPHFK